MSKEFLNCVKNGGRVRTERLNSKEYCHYCFIGGKSYRGETKTYKKLSTRKTKTA